MSQSICPKKIKKASQASVRLCLSTSGAQPQQLWAITTDYFPVLVPLQWMFVIAVPTTLKIIASLGQLLPLQHFFVFVPSPLGLKRSS